MTTYNSYEEAKIANPDSEIVTTGISWDGDSDLIGKFEVLDTSEVGAHYIGDVGWANCNPSYYCITFNQCNEFKIGMVVLEGTKVIELNALDVSLLNTMKSDEIQRDSWDSCYILRAAALEEPKHVKVEYVKLDMNAEGSKFWEVARDWAEGNREFRFMRGSGAYDTIDNNDELLKIYTNRNILVRTETEITERDEFIEAALKVHLETSSDDKQGLKGLVSAMYDSGKFKLVD